MSLAMATNPKPTRAMKEFGDRLKAARLLAGYNYAEDFAKDVGVEAPRYRRYERGDAWPPLEVLLKISELTNTRLDMLLAGRK